MCVIYFTIFHYTVFLHIRVFMFTFRVIIQLKYFMIALSEYINFVQVVQID